MQVCTSLQTDNHASTHHSVFTGRMPFLPPNQQRQSTEGMSTEDNNIKTFQRSFCGGWLLYHTPSYDVIRDVFVLFTFATADTLASDHQTSGLRLKLETLVSSKDRATRRVGYVTLCVHVWSRSRCVVYSSPYCAPPSSVVAFLLLTFQPS